MPTPHALPQHDTVAIFCETPFQYILCLNAAVNCLGAKECIVFPVQDMYMSAAKFTVTPQPPLVRHIYPVRRAQYSQSRWQGHLNHLRYGKNYTLLDFMYKFPTHVGFTAAVGIRYTDRCRRILTALGKQVPYYMVEEGIGEYSWPREAEELCAETLPQCPMFTGLEHICLIPELFRAMYPAETVHPAPPIAPGDPLRKLVQAQLCPQGTLPKLPGVLYFHQPLDDRFTDPAQQQALVQTENDTLALLEQAAPGYQLKLHPRDHAADYPPQRVLQMPAAWEAAPCLQNIEDMLLISESSTALISPKLLFDQEPKVLVLECLYPQNPANEQAHQGRIRLMQTVKQLYRDPTRFQIPQTWPELQAALQTLTQ